MQSLISLTIAAALATATASTAMAQPTTDTGTGSVCIFDCDTGPEAPETPEMGSSSVFDETADGLDDGQFLGDLSPDVAVPDAPDLGERDGAAEPSQ